MSGARNGQDRCEEVKLATEGCHVHMGLIGQDGTTGECCTPDQPAPPLSLHHSEDQEGLFAGFLGTSPLLQTGST